MRFKIRPQFPDVSIGRYSKVSKDTSIGAHSYLGRNCFVTKSQIGRYVSIGNNVSIGNGEHDLKRISTSSMFYEDSYGELTKGECTIESDVWIGVDSIIRRNVHLGVGAAIGANSFVNSDIPAFAIAVGSPARVVGYRFPPEIQKQILDSNWWLKEPEQAGQLIKSLEQSLDLGQSKLN